MKFPEIALAVISVFLKFLAASCSKVTNPSRVPKNAVLLSKVSSLTLRSDKLTTSRRVSPISQLECIGPGEICQLYHVDVVRCTNEGADYDAENIQWSCKASLPEEFKLGSTDVICEGYESSDDPYVLKGSCGVEYRLLLTDKGEQKYGKVYHNNGQGSSDSESRSTRLSAILFFIIFAVVLFVILKGIWSNWNRHPSRPGGTRPSSRRGGGGGGGGGNNDDDDPPPPYDDHPSYYYSSPRKSKTQSTSSRTRPPTTATSSRSTSQREQQQQGWRPGFWSGTAAGAAAGYFLGNRGQARNETRQNEPLRQPETQQRQGGLFNNFGAQQQNWQPAPAPASRSSTSSNSAPSYSASRHESTGFGSTKRR